MTRCLVFIFLAAICCVTYLYLNKDDSRSHEILLGETKIEKTVIDNNTLSITPKPLKQKEAKGLNVDLFPQEINDMRDNKNIISAVNDKNIPPVLDANDTSYMFYDGKEQNTGPVINADDTSPIFDNSEGKNIGTFIDVNDVTFFYESEKLQNTGNAISASKEGYTYKSGFAENIGSTLGPQDKNL